MNLTPSILSIGLVLAVTSGLAASAAAEKESHFQGAPLRASSTSAAEGGAAVAGGGYRTAIQHAAIEVPLAVVGGTPYEMGWHLGRLMRREIGAFVPVALERFKARLQLTDARLDAVWSTTAAYTDDRFEQELLGLADGSGLRLRVFQHLHCLPLLLPYSCSSIAAWGPATADGHLYQTRNLDWDLEAGAHEFPLVVVYLPAEGVAHVHPTFAGVIGANCGMNARGIVLAEMGDSPEREMPYFLRAPHFTTWFRTLLYDAGSLGDVLETFHQLPHTKRYHCVFADGQSEKRAVKIRAHQPEPPGQRIAIWKDNDPTDELAPEVLPSIVYQDEGRGAYPTLKAHHGELDADKLIALCNQIPIRGGNVLNAVFDATALRLWVAYARGSQEAYQRPYLFLDLETLDGDGDGTPDLREAVRDVDGNRRPDFIDP